MALHYTSLDQLSAPYAQIVLSPHLDDAALSCGGLIAAAAVDGSPVLVLNLCSGSPDPTIQLSPFATDLHARWGLDAATAVSQRLAEDATALETLGVDSYQLDLLDAIYRLPEAYQDEATLFGMPAPGDPLAAQIFAALERLVARYPYAVFYAPLAIGHHVDHQAAFLAATRLAHAGYSVAFYEDFPYVTVDGALGQRLTELGGQEAFSTTMISIDSVLARKIAAIDAYASQLTVLFGDSPSMAQAVISYAERLQPTGGRYGERLWLRRFA